MDGGEDEGSGTRLFCESRSTEVGGLLILIHSSRGGLEKKNREMRGILYCTNNTLGEKFFNVLLFFSFIFFFSLHTCI